MEININKKALIVSGLSLSLLAGCLDDPYHYPEEEVVPPPPSNTSKIYGPESDGTFALSVIDKDALQAPINADGFVSQGNVSTSNISGQTQGNLNLRIAESAAARLVAHSSNSANLNMDIADPATSTLQFALRVMDKPTVDQDIYLTTQREDGKDLGKVSLTSAVMAYTSAAPQTVKVPLSCFTDAHMDYSDTFAPFVLHSSSNLNVDIGDIRVVTNSVEEDHVLACDSKSTFVKVDDGQKFSSLLKIINPEEKQGWATGITPWMTDGSEITSSIAGDNITFTHTNAGDGANGGIVLIANDGLTHDVAQFVETGWIEFMFHVGSYGAHPTQRFQIQMESTEGNSQPYYLPEAFAENSWQQVKVPLKALFTLPDGSIDVEVLRNINKPLSLLPEWVEAGNTLQGMQYSLANVQIIVE